MFFMKPLYYHEAIILSHVDKLYLNSSKCSCNYYSPELLRCILSHILYGISQQITGCILVPTQFFFYPLHAHCGEPMYYMYFLTKDTLYFWTLRNVFQRKNNVMPNLYNDENENLTLTYKMDSLSIIVYTMYYISVCT